MVDIRNGGGGERRKVQEGEVEKKVMIFVYFTFVLDLLEFDSLFNLMYVYFSFV